CKGESVARNNASAVESGDENISQSGDENKDDRSLTEKIIDFLLSKAPLPKVALFHTRDGKGYVTFKNADHCQTHAIDSKLFRMFTMNLIRHKFKKTVSRSVMDTVISALEAAAITQFDEQMVYYRYARLDDEIYIDLGNSKWDAVRVTAEGWEIV